MQAGRTSKVNHSKIADDESKISNLRSAGQSAFEQTLNNLAISLGSHDTRDVTVEVFGRTYCVPVREGGGNRLMLEKELVEILHYESHFKVRATLPPTGLFANLGVKSKFGSARGGYDAEVEVKKDEVSGDRIVESTSLFGKVSKGKCLEYVSRDSARTACEMNLQELAAELKKHPSADNRGEPLEIALEFAESPSEVAVVNRPVAPNFIDQLISNRIYTATQCSFTGRAPSAGDFWAYGLNWSFGDALNGRMVTVEFCKNQEGAWGRKKLVVYADAVDQSQDSKATGMSCRTRPVLQWDASIENWRSTGLSLDDALDELQRVPNYILRSKQVGLESNGKIVIARPTDSGSGWTVFDLALQFALVDLSEFRLRLPPELDSVTSIFGLTVPALPLKGLSTIITYRKGTDGESKATLIECYEDRNVDSRFVSGVNPSSAVLTVDLEKVEVTSSLTLDRYLTLLEMHHPKKEDTPRAKVIVEGREHNISFESQGAGIATQLLCRFIKTAPQITVQAKLTDASHLHLLGLQSEFSPNLYGDKIEATFRFGKRV